MGDLLLTDPQQSALEVGLRSIERELAWMEGLLGWTYEGPTVSYVEDLTDSKRQGLRAHIHEAREIIREIRDTFALRPDRIPKSAWIAGRLAHLWVYAEECQSRYLRSYGEISPELRPRLDPPARRLAELLLAMQQLAREGVVGESPSHEVSAPMGRLSGSKHSRC